MELVKHELDALTIASQVEQLKGLGAVLAKSGLLPKGINTPEQVVTIILKAREMGVPPMVGLSHIAVINGKPTLSAELMLSMALQSGHDVWIAETSAESCTVKGVRLGKSREQSLTFTIAEAKQAGVTGKDVWRQYPAAMLRARAISAFMRMFAPDVLVGASHTAEELGAEVDGEGEIIDVPLRPATEPDPPPVIEHAGPQMVTPSQLTALSIALKEAGFTAETKDQGRAFLAWLAETEGLQTSRDLTKGQAQIALDKIGSGENGAYRTDRAKLDRVFQDYADWQAGQEADAQPDQAEAA